MARARNIKPGFFKSYELADLGPHVQLLFAGLWCLADREGRLKDQPRLIKAEIFPYYDVNVNGGLTLLNESGFVKRYTVNGEAFIQILKFSEHQSPHNTEKPSKIPGLEHADQAEQPANPHESSITQKNGALTVDSRKSNGGNRSDSLIPDSLIPDSLIPDDCAEPQSDSTPAVIEMPITGSKDFPIRQMQIDEWTAAYPAVDVVRQLAAMRQWCLANPTRKKTARGVLAFCNSWLMREQDKPHAQPRASPSHPTLGKAG